MGACVCVRARISGDLYMVNVLKNRNLDLIIIWNEEKKNIALIISVYTNTDTEILSISGSIWLWLHSDSNWHSVAKDHNLQVGNPRQNFFLSFQFIN